MLYLTLWLNKFSNLKSKTTNQATNQLATSDMWCSGISGLLKTIMHMIIPNDSIESNVFYFFHFLFLFLLIILSFNVTEERCEEGKVSFQCCPVYVYVVWRWCRAAVKLNIRR